MLIKTALAINPANNILVTANVATHLPISFPSETLLICAWSKPNLPKIENNATNP